jgi:hypothetical protein
MQNYLMMLVYFVATSRMNIVMLNKAEDKSCKLFKNWKDWLKGELTNQVDELS